MNSPITNKPAQEIEKISTEFIINRYKSELNIDVTQSFSGVREISLYQCRDTSFRFFKPNSIAGDGKFYELLSRSFQNYYEVDKWEHEEAIRIIKEKFNGANRISTVEIGCAEGEFLQRLQQLVPQVVPHGVDINSEAVKIANTRGIQATVGTIEEFSRQNQESFDLVLMFQVLEHIPEIDSFLKAAVHTLKPNGMLIIAVPNSDSFILKNDRYHTLNLPPHHMGWWNDKSLNSLASYYDLKCKIVAKEPTDFKHSGEYYKAFLNTLTGKLGKYIYPATRFAVKPLLPLFLGKNEGMSILAAYEKV